MAEFEQQNPDDFFSQFLDDYFAESEEHLAIIKRGLLNLEKYIDRTVLDTTQVDELFRSFHTIKGNSGMVGLSSAERLAHQLEGYLRLLQQKALPLKAVGFDALLEGTRTLEQVIEADRKHEEEPDIAHSLTSSPANFPILNCRFNGSQFFTALATGLTRNQVATAPGSVLLDHLRPLNNFGLGRGAARV